jgi:hypothetical protein
MILWSFPWTQMFSRRKKIFGVLTVNTMILRDYNGENSDFRVLMVKTMILRVFQWFFKFSRWIHRYWKNDHRLVPVTGGTVTGWYRLPVEPLPVRTGHRWNGYRLVPVTGETVTGWDRSPVERLQYISLIRSKKNCKFLFQLKVHYFTIHRKYLFIFGISRFASLKWYNFGLSSFMLSWWNYRSTKNGSTRPN